MNNINESVIQEFMKLVGVGDEILVRQFLIDHIKEFPEKIQEKIVSAFFFETLGKQADLIKKRAELQKKILSLFDDIKKAEQNLTEEKQKIEVRGKLNS